MGTCIMTLDVLETGDLDKSIKNIKKDFGIFFTPKWVVDFMVNLIDEKKLNSRDINILEPASGIGQFLQGIKTKRHNLFIRAKHKVAVEINKEFVKQFLKYNIDNSITVVNDDYLLWKTDKIFDLIIGNPPYGIPSLSKHYSIKIDNETKKLYKQYYETWYGKYNVYGAFIEKSIKLLKENGQLIFIIPATFMILDEFKKLRNFLSENGKTEIIYMGSDLFKPEANITTVILNFTKSKKEKNRLKLYEYRDKKLNLIYKKDDWSGDIVLFKTDFSKELEKICSFRIDDIYSIKISPRTPEIKNNPDVIKSKDYINGSNIVPILNGKNLKIGKVIYEPISGYWIDINKKTKLRKFFDRPHIVLGLGFRGDGQIGAGYDYKSYPWMGDVYHLLRKNTLINNSFNLTEEEVVNFLNSEIVKRYVKDIFRDITYHFSITQLKLIPLPLKEELKVLKEIL
ncbi:MAG: DNA methyltransferase [Persephonella sp.]|nr:MAG: DNA methyltransferase [Persephonella sp.]